MKTIDTLDNRPFRHLITTIGALPTSFIDSMSYYEMLAWLCDYLEKNVIPAVNENAEVLKELKDYVENYFENLDVQEEINNKLDQMAEDGELAEIIAEYLNSNAVLGFATVADMQDAENLTNNSLVETYGFYAKGDGGGAKYQIRTVLNTDVIDSITLFSLHDDTLVAELINDNNMNIKKGGAKEEADFDCSTIINTFLETFSKVYVDEGTYLCNNILIKSGNQIIGVDRDKSILKCNETDGIVVLNDSTITLNAKISNLTIEGDDLASCGLKLEYFTHSSEVNNVNIIHCDTGCYVTKAWYAQFNNLDIHHCGRCLELNSTEGQINAIQFVNSYFRSATTDYTVYIKYANTNTINALKFDTVTIESSNSHGLYVDSTENGVRNILITNSYFEANSGNCIDGTGTDLEVNNTFFNPSSTAQTIINSHFKNLVVKNCYEEASFIPNYSINHSGQYVFIDGYNPQKASAINLTHEAPVAFINNAWNNQIMNQTLVNPSLYKNISYGSTTDQVQQTFRFNDSAFDNGAPYQYIIREKSYGSWDGSRLQFLHTAKGGSDIIAMTIMGRTTPKVKINNDSTFAIPSGTTGERPTNNLEPGVIFYDKTLGKVMVYNGSTWDQL